MTTFSTDPALYIFTSLTAGSSHIVTATSRLETILRANRVPFKAVDLATDQKARMLWGRRAGKDASGRVRKLPGLAQEGLILGVMPRLHSSPPLPFVTPQLTQRPPYQDLVEIEDWNEYGELRQHVKIYYDEFTIPTIHNKPKDPPKRFVHPITGAPVKGGSKAGSKAAAGAAAAAAAASASSSSSAKPAAPPAAPPLPPADEKKAATAAPAKKAETGEKVTMPIRSIADEAAQKAKDLRLAALREKVHGSKAKAEEKAKAEAKAAAAKTEDKALDEKQTEDKPTKNTDTKSTEQDTPAENEAQAKPAPTTPAKTTASTSTPSLATTASSSAAASSSNTISAFRAATALQSPTRTTWVPASPASTDALRETLQSPTTARWKAAATFEAPAASHMGAALAAASQEDIAAIEKAEAIPEEDEDEDEDEEDEDEEEEEEESSEEEEEEESSEEDSDEEESEEDGEEKAKAAVGKPAAAASASTVTAERK
ncbi:hypothetical protein EV126DRAFT_493379 [Verticillium dahliae]|nr:hypothetical protein EV126DRAFT_493379 [Verticillium dahliae]